MVMKFPRSFYLHQRYPPLSSSAVPAGGWCRLRNVCFAVALFALVVLSRWEIPTSNTSGTRSVTPPPPFLSTPPKLTKSLAHVLQLTQQQQQSDQRAAKESSSSLPTTMRLKVPPVLPISCHDVRLRVQRTEWTDPNHGILYARTLTSDPSFRMAVHTQQYDNVRWKSIYVKGEYYETNVHERFVRILTAPTNHNKSNSHSQPQPQQPPPRLVIDVGMNIGYYTLLSAVLGHTVIGFEINPANLIRVCESLDLNQMGDGGTSGAVSPVAIFQRGVSNVSDQALRLVVPSNPGQAKMMMDSAATADTTAAAAVDTVVTTITLDDFASAYNWWEIQPTIALLKIDVEGLEPEIIIGAERLLRSGLVQHVLTEFRDFTSPLAQRAIAILFDNEYVLTSYDGLPLSRDATMALWNDYRRGYYHEPWRRTARAFLLRRPFVKDLWFSLRQTRH